MRMLRTQQVTAVALLALVLCLAATAFGQDYQIIPSGFNAGNPVHPNDPTFLRTSGDTTSSGVTELFDGDDPLNANTSNNYWSPVVNIPFPVVIGGQSFNQFCVNKNGLITFDTSVANTPCPQLDVNTSLPNADLPNNTIAAFWGDFGDPGGNGNVSGGDDIDAHVYGNAPNRQYWIQYWSWEIDSSSFFYFALVFNEGSPYFHVVDMYGGSSSSSFTVGIQLDAATAFEADVDLQGGTRISPNQRPAGNSFTRFDNEYFTFWVPPVEIDDSFTVPSVWSGTQLQATQVNATSGSPPYTFSVNDVSNAEWVTIDPATGLLSGIAPLSAATTATITVTVRDAAGTMSTSSPKTFDVFSLLPQGFREDFENGTDDFIVQSGVSAATTLLPTGGASASQGLQFAAANNNGWSVLSTTADDVEAWLGATAANHRHVAEFFIEAPSASSVEVTFDYLIENNVGSANAANLGVVMSDNAGQTWSLVSGPLADSFGGYRTPTAGFVTEQFTFSVSGNQDVVGVRIISLVRNTSDLTRVVVDNIEFSIPVEITTTALPPAQAEVLMTPATIQAVGGDIASYTWSEDPANPLPEGLIVVDNGLTATIEGVPPEPQSGSTVNFGVRLQDVLGGEHIVQYAMPILPAPAKLLITTSPLLATTTEGQYSEWPLALTGGHPPYTWSFADPDNVPIWLSIDADTGLLFGTPDEVNVTDTVSIRVVDSADRTVDYQDSDQVDFVLVYTDELMVDPTAFANTSVIGLGVAEESRSYNVDIPLVGGSAPYGWILKSGSQLPPGLLLTAEGEFPSIRGALAQDSSNGSPYTFTIVVNDAIGYPTSHPNYDPDVSSSGTQVTELRFRLEVTESFQTSLIVATAQDDIPNLIAAGGSFQTFVEAVGGIPPYTFSLVGNSAGFASITSAGLLTINAEGVQPGNYLIDIEVLDTTSARTTRLLGFEVAEPYMNPLIDAPLNLPATSPSSEYNYVVDFRDGEGPYTWTLVNGTDANADGEFVSPGMPAGITFRPNGGVVSGIVMANVSTGNYTLTLRLTDNRGNFDERTFTIPVTAGTGSDLQITTEDLNDAVLNINYGATLRHSGGVGDVRWRLKAGSDSLPGGLFLSETGVIAGVPTLVSGSPSSITVEAIDGSGAIVEQTLQLSVVASPNDGNNGGAVSSPGVPGAPSNAGGGSCSVGGSDGNALWLMLLASLLLLSVTLRARPTE